MNFYRSFLEYVLKDIIKIKNLNEQFINQLRKNKLFEWIYINYIRYFYNQENVMQHIEYCYKNNETMFHTKAKKNQFTENIQQLELIDSNYETVASVQVDYGWVPTEVDFLELDIKYTCLNNRTRVIHKLAERGYRFNDEILCKLKNEDGNTVYHIMAKNGWITDNENILKLTNKNYESVAHIIARYYLHKLEDIPFLENEDILLLRDQFGNTVLHDIALYKNYRKLLTKDKLKIKNNYGWSVAHTIVDYRSRIFKDTNPIDIDILKISDNNGWSVAHQEILTYDNIEFSNPEILQLKDKRGISVDFLQFIKQLTKEYPNKMGKLEIGSSSRKMTLKKFFKMFTNILQYNDVKINIDYRKKEKSFIVTLLKDYESKYTFSLNKKKMPKNKKQKLLDKINHIIEDCSDEKEFFNKIKSLEKEI